MSEIILPGLIDVHVHLRQPGGTHKEDFYTGTRAALRGGYTMLLDMPNNVPPIDTPESLGDKKYQAWGKIYCDVGFNYLATPTSAETFERVSKLVTAYKLYLNPSTGDHLVEDPKDIEKIVSSVPKGKILMVHSEGKKLDQVISIARDAGTRLHICHVSLAQEVSSIEDAKKEGLDITAEATLHHRLFTSKQVEEVGSFAKMKPPLAREYDRLAVWEAMNNGVIDMVASDHAPHTIQEKLSKNAPMGVPGIETSLPLLMTAVAKGELSLDRLRDLMHTNPKRIFGLPDQPDTYIKVNTDRTYAIDIRELMTKCGWTPFAGMEVAGRVEEVIFKGTQVFLEGKITSMPLGRIIEC